MQIIDAHHHLWDLEENYLPWLCDRTISFRYGDYRAIRRSYLPDHYRQDSTAFNIVGSVYVEAEWNPTDPTGEVEWVDRIRGEHALPSVMVAQAWLDRPDIEAVLFDACAFEFVRGVRHKPAAAVDRRAIDPGCPGSMGDPAWRSGYRMLSQYDLSFDLQTPWWHLREALELVELAPETPIILNHCGLPADRSPEGLEGWRAALRLLASAPNAAIKISGLGVLNERWSTDTNRRVVLDAIDIFGVERCMFASNYPVDSLVASFKTIFDGFLNITASLSRAEQCALFHDNAARIYRIPASKEQPR